jgi:hypothetical protein
MKSYDGGRNWEPAQPCGDFATASDLAQALRSEHPAIRTRVDLRATSGRIRVRKPNEMRRDSGSP